MALEGIVLSDSRRVMIIGLDGATFDLIDPWVAQGALPVISELLGRGASARLQSTLPPVTPTAWSTALTGCNPGKHGVFDFAQFVPGSYEPVLTSAASLRMPTLFQLASQAGLNIVSHNVPWTYPPEPVNGVMYAGFGAPAFDRRIAYPPEAFDDLARIANPETFELPLLRNGELSMRALRDRVRQEGEAAVWLARDKPWDLFMTVFSATDQIAHIVFENRRSRDVDGTVIEDVLLETYRMVDTQLGRLLELAGEDTCVLVLSDHGFGTLDGVVNFNAVLASLGLLKTSGGPRLGGQVVAARRLPFLRWLRGTLMRISPATVARFGKLPAPQVDWSQTAAVTYGPNSQVRFNIKGRDPLGIVEPFRVEELAARITEAFCAITDPRTGRPVVAAMHMGRELYPGAHTASAPDMVVETADCAYQNVDIFKIGARRVQSQQTQRHIMQQRSGNAGTHRRDGILIATGPRVSCRGRGDRADLCDIAPTVLGALGIPVPETMDGHALTSLLEGLEIRYTAETPQPWERCVTQTAAGDEAQLAARLAELGYL